ncbi:MAG: energy transducer TonB [Dehalococcoidia bacterium]|jgi:TonB family protein|nr:energy transducer TonB [Dehalococcoidia bacterium]
MTRTAGIGQWKASVTVRLASLWKAVVVALAPTPGAAVPHTSLRSDDGPPVPLFGASTHPQRFSRAFGVSVGSHIAIFVIAGFIAAMLDARRETPFLPDLRSFDIVWVPMEGPGGGGGGGGNEMPEPPRQVELEGPDATSVPVSAPPELENPEVEDEPDEPEQEMNIPARTLASSAQTLPGVMQGLPVAQAMSLSQGLGVGGGGGTGEGTGIGPGTGAGLGPGEGGGAGGGVYRPGAGIVLPRPIREVKPQYTADAMRAKVQGSVWIEAIVTPEGTVGEVRVTKSLDRVFGLDEEAMRAARQWRFVPGTRFGQPVAVLVVIELTFTLR